ncbi:MAG TPA: type ISP restriction/modification enzyme [Candidatus Wunengus sp. YC65]|uniref:type ISP restriction/modification enzyme n=1 Tax=Candidatus Wunengus sp. YC65 TaxID=3367701 RepID=UPI004025283C
MEPEIFDYQIGGYQVCEKWLKDRKCKKLSLDDIKHYCNIVTAIRKTIEIQIIVDSIYPKLEDEIISNI